MAVAIAWTLALDATGSSGFQGLADIGNSRLLATRLNRQVWRSADRGATWTQLSDLPIGAGAATSRILSMATDECLVAVQNAAAGALHIYRTTDGGDNWTKVHDTVTGFTLTICHGFLQTGASTVTAYGSFNPTLGGGSDYHFLTSGDRGASWTPGSLINATVAGSSVGGMALVGSTFIAGQADFSAPPFVWTSGDQTTWTKVILPGNTAGTNANTWDLVALSATAALATGGFINDSDIGPSPDHQVLWIWKTTDAGASWTRVPNASIASAPTDNVSAAALIFLDTDIAVVGYGYTNDPEIGWRHTEDGGATWAVNTGSLPPDATFYSPAQMVFYNNNDGTGLLVSAAGWDEAASGGGEIWLGAVTGLPFEEDDQQDASSAVTPAVVHCSGAAFATKGCRQRC